MRRIRTPVVALLLGCIVLVGLDRPTEAQNAAAEAAKAAAAAALTGKALSQGEVSVIVGLLPAIRFVPESALGLAGIASQRSDITNARAALLADLAGRGAIEYASWPTLPYVALRVDLAALQRLASSPLVTSIQEDGLSSPQLASSTALIGADVTVASGFRGDNWAVAILDTGIDTNHPFFSGRVVAQACFSAAAGGETLCPGGGNTQTGPGAAEVTDGANPIPACDDGHGNQLCDHGSHVTGIAAGEDPPTTPQGFNGVAPGAFIIAIQIFTRFTSAGACQPGPAPCVRSWTTDQIHALNYVNTTLVPLWDIAAVNMSLGGGQNNVACDGDALKAPIDALLANGVATVIASGNDGWTDTISSPGCISTAVTVGAVTDADAVIFNMGNLVDILAPGQDVISSVPDDTFGSKDGTSMATPFVTGAFAVIRSIVGTSMSVADILALLQNAGPLIKDTRTAFNPPGAGGGTLTGYVRPRLQLDAAVAAAVAATTVSGAIADGRAWGFGEGLKHGFVRINGSFPATAGDVDLSQSRLVARITSLLNEADDPTVGGPGTGEVMAFELPLNLVRRLGTPSIATLETPPGFIHPITGSRVFGRLALFTCVALPCRPGRALGSASV